jgi:hypothetical protein
MASTSCERSSFTKYNPPKRRIISSHNQLIRTAKIDDPEFGLIDSVLEPRRRNLRRCVS